MNKIRTHIVAIGLFFSVLLIVVASLNYPGGSIHDIHAPGYSWTENYITNLLDYTALNGEPNSARPFAVAGAVLMGLTMGLGFVRFAGKVNLRHYSPVIRSLAFLLMGFSTLITVPTLHDLMVTLGCIATLLIFFYQTILFFHTKLLLFKCLSVLLLLTFYGATFMYFGRTGLDFLPIVQKLIHLFQILWMLGLEYGTKKEDFLNAVK